VPVAATAVPGPRSIAATTTAEPAARPAARIIVPLPTNRAPITLQLHHCPGNVHPNCGGNASFPELGGTSSCPFAPCARGQGPRLTCFGTGRRRLR
jgi:hypothetical protein